MQKQVYEFISKQNNDPILERRTCRRTGEEFAVFKGDVDLLHTIAPKFGENTFDFLLPDLGPTARMIRRMMFRNERGLYTTESMISHTKLPSMYHADSGIQSISADERENLDLTTYGQDYDSQVPFMQQFQKLYYATPKVGLLNLNNENGKYDNFSSYNKNTYLNADIMYSENVSYSTTIKNVKNGYDLLQVNDSELVYDSLCSSKLTKCYDMYYCSNCYDCGFSVTCRNCSNCRFCDNQENKQNLIFNKPASKEEIQQIKEKIKSYAGYKSLKKDFMDKVWNAILRPARREINCENTIGSTIYNSKNAVFCFDSYDLQDCRYCLVGENNANCMDTTIFNRNAHGVYQAICGGFLTKSYACLTGWESSYMYFCDFCVSCEYMIGCCGLKNKKYCILNKQYSKEERYMLAEEIFEKIKTDGERGEFFPSEISPFPYNDTVAMDYYPVNEKQVTILNPEKFISDALLDFGGTDHGPTQVEKIRIKRRTREHDITIPSHVETIRAQDLPDGINEVNNDICSKVILCERTGRPFKITTLELEFYRKMGIALPRVHHDIRHQRRTWIRPPRELFFRKSDKSGIEMVSNYSKDVPYRVYTQEEYMKEIY